MEDNVFEIEKVLQSSVRKGLRYYRVRWKGFGEEEDTWEPEENLFDCKDVLDEFWQKSKKDKQTKSEVKKRKSESIPQCQTTKAKKRKDGRTTNNSTIARIDSSSLQSETIIIPETKEISTVKQAKPKKKKNKMEQKDKGLDINQEPKKAGKRRGRKPKNLSSKTELDQPCQPQGLRDENENVTNTNSEKICPPDKVNPLLLIIDDEPESLLENTAKEKVILLEKSGKNLRNKGVTKRGHLTSISSEASPEYVPEYCDETLAYDICAEEEFEFFGETDYFVKDSIGYEKSGIGTIHGAAIVEGCKKDNDNSVRENKVHLISDDGHVGSNTDVTGDGTNVKKNDENHVKVGEDHVKDETNRDKGHLNSNDGHVNSNDGHVNSNDGHVNSDKDDVKEGKDHVEDDEGHVKDDKEHVKDDKEHVKYNSDHVKYDEDRVKDDDNLLVKKDDHVKDYHRVEDNDLVKNDDKSSDDRLNDDKDHGTDNDDHVKDDDHEENNKHQIDDGEEEMEVDSGNGNDEQDRVKEGEDHVKDNAANVKDGENTLTRESHAERLVNDGGVDEDVIETVLPVKEIETKEEEQKDDNEKDKNIPSTNTLNVERPLNSSTNNDKVDRIIIYDNSGASSEGDGKLLDKNIDGVISQDDIKPSETGIALEKDSGLEPMVGDLPLGYSASTEESIDVDQTVNADHQKKPNLMLKIRSSSFGSTCLTDSECMSPEFVQLPEPKKGVFDIVFAAKTNDTTDGLTSEMKNKGSEIEYDISKNAECKTIVQEVCKDDLSREPNKELDADEQQKCCAVIAENKNVDCSEIPEMKTRDSVGLKTVETRAVGIESKESQGELLDATRDKSVPKIYEVKTRDSVGLKTVETKAVGIEIKESGGELLDATQDKSVPKVIEVKTCDSVGLKMVETRVVGIESKESGGKLLDATQDKSVPKKNGENEKSCARSLSPTNQQRRLSDEETALCLLDLSCAKSGKAADICEIKFQAPSKEFTKSSNIGDASKQDKKGVLVTSVSSGPPGGSARKKDKEETNQQLSVKRKSNENKNEAHKKRSKVLVNIPFMVQESGNEVIDLLQDLKEYSASPTESNTDFISQSSPAIDKRKTSATDPVAINEHKKENNVHVVAASESSHVQTRLPLSKEVRSTPSVREQGIHHSEKKHHKTFTSSSHIKNKTLSVPNEEASSGNSSEKKTKRLLKKKVERSERTESRKIEGKPETTLVEDETEKKHKTDIVTSSSFEEKKSELVSSQRRLTKSQEGLSSSSGKDAQHIQTTASSSVSVKRSSSSCSDDANISNVHSKETYDANMQGISSLSWGNDSSKTYPYSAQLKPPSLSQVNPNLYPTGFNPLIVSHLNQKGFYPQVSFPFTTAFNQPSSSNSSNLVNQKPFSAVAGLNWYPDNRPRPVRLITAPMFLSNQLYFLPTSSQLSQQTLHNDTYGRALQEMAKRKQTENGDQPVSDSEEFSSSIDTDKASYVKHVGNTSQGSSSHDIKNSGEIMACVQSQIDIQAREFIDQAELNKRASSCIDRSNNIVVSITDSKNDDFSSAAVKTRPSADKSNTRTSFALQQSELLSTAKEKGGPAGKCGETLSNKISLDGKHGQGDITCETSGEQMVLDPSVCEDKKKHFEKMETINLTEKSKEATCVGNRRTSSESKVAGSLPTNKTTFLDHTVSEYATSHAKDNVMKKATENSESIQKSLEEMKIAKSTESDKTTPESVPDSSSDISTKSLQLIVSKSGISDPTVTNGGIHEPKDQAVYHGKNNLTSNSAFNQESSLREAKSNNNENSDTVTQLKKKDRDQDQGKINDKPSSNSEPKQKPFLEEIRNPKSASESGKRCIKERESSRESPSKDQKDRTKIASLSKEDDRRSGRDTKGRELKKQESDDSEVEFDLDDYNPEEVITHKPEKMEITHSGIPTALSLREVKFAIKQGNAATVLASLAGGMNVDSQDSVTGMTLLMRAVSFGQDNIVKLLLSHGANINIKDNTGSTPLIAACEQGFENIVSLLLSVETDINAKQSMSGETALIKACMNGHYSVVAMLLAHGADCQMRSVTGLTAAQLAVQCGHFEIRDLLESHSKKLQRCVETAISSCLCDSSKLMYPPLLPFVSLYPSEGQNFTYHFHCSDMLLSKTILLFCLRAVFSRSGQVDLSFSKDNGVHTVLLNGSIQSPVLPSSKSVFVLRPKMDTNRLILQTYQSHVHLLVCIYAAEVEENLALL